ERIVRIGWWRRFRCKTVRLRVERIQWIACGRVDSGICRGQFSRELDLLDVDAPVGEKTIESQPRANKFGGRVFIIGASRHVGAARTRRLAHLINSRKRQLPRSSR